MLYTCISFDIHVVASLNRVAIPLRLHKDLTEQMVISKDLVCKQYKV